MKTALFVHDKTGRHALLFSLCFALLHGALTAPVTGGFLHWITLIPAAVSVAVLALHAGVLALALPPAAALLAAWLLGAPLPTLVFSLCFFACGLLLALVMRKRIERIVAIALLAVTCLLFLAGSFLWECAQDAVATGAPDLVTYLRDGLAEVQENFVVALREIYEIGRQQNAQAGIQVEEFPETAMRTLVANTFATLPAYLGVFLVLLALGMTYGMQFVSYMRGNNRAFAVTTWPYRIGPVTAIGYIILIPISVFWGDYSSALYVALLNLFILLTPLLVLGEAQTLPQFFREYRRLTGGRVPLFFVLMAVTVFLISPGYTLVGFALLYAIRVIKLAFGASRTPTEE